MFAPFRRGDLFAVQSNLWFEQSWIVFGDRESFNSEKFKMRSRH